MAENIRCSFCGRHKNEVKQLIEGINTYICDGCIFRSYDAIHDKEAEDGDEDAPLPKPLELMAQLDEYVIGQTQAKRTVAVAVYNHYKRLKAQEYGFMFEGESVDIQKSNILITGSSGCGKTQIARVIARILGVPFFIQDATKLTQAGYVGDDTDVIIQGLLEKADGDVELAQKGLVVLDEIDKLGRKSGLDQSGYRDVSGEGAQQALLKLVEGGEITVAEGKGARLIDASQQKTVTVDTTNILFIGMGSFDGMQDVIQKRMNKEARLGFGGTPKGKVDNAKIFEDITEDDILEFGIIPELAGRMPVLTSVLKLTEEELVRVLTEPKDALVKQYKALYQMEDRIDLQFEDAALRAIARKASGRKTGARALRGILEELLLPFSLEAPSNPEIEAIRLTEDYVEGRTDSPLIVQGKKRLQAAIEG